MTPDQRLNQIEPELAEVLRKVDRLIEGQGRLIEGQGQLTELTTGMRAELEQVKAELGRMKATGEITYWLSEVNPDRQRHTKPD